MEGITEFNTKEAISSIEYLAEAGFASKKVIDYYTGIGKVVAAVSQRIKTRSGSGIENLGVNPRLPIYAVDNMTLQLNKSQYTKFVAGRINMLLVSLEDIVDIPDNIEGNVRMTILLGMDWKTLFAGKEKDKEILSAIVNILLSTEKGDDLSHLVVDKLASSPMHWSCRLYQSIVS